MRRDSIVDLVALARLLLLGMALTGCGGSASETPFPQPPIERELAARHERANADASTDSPTSSPGPATSAAVSTDPNDTSTPVATPASEPEPAPPAAF